MRQVLTELILGAVFAGSVLNQLHFPWWERIVARFDRIVLLPYWAFFAPNPGFAGVHLVFRDRTSAGLSCWAEILLPATTGWRWLWNPARYERKALQDLLSGLARNAEKLQHTAGLELTDSYLVLLAWVEAQPAVLAESTARQFAVLQTVGYGAQRRVRPVFVSREHPHG